MPKPQDEIVDPLVLAAMVEDPDEDDEDKQKREEFMKSAGLTDDDTPSEEDDEEEEEEPKEEDEEEEETPGEVDPNRPAEAEDDEDEDVDESLEGEEEEEEGGKTRQEKRTEQRKQAFFDSIKRDKPTGSQRQVPNYQPLDYEKEPLDENGNPREYKPEELEQDRKAVGAVQFARGATTAKYWAEQEQFWNDIENDAKLVSYDDDLKFLAEELPNGKPNPDFDPDKAAEINEMYLQLVGFKQIPKTNAQGQQLVDPQTRQPLVNNVVDRTDISYEKFARRYVDNMSKWSKEAAESTAEETKKKVTKQRKRQGIRPGGKSRRSLGNLKLGDITKMSDEEFEKNEEEIDRQILDMLS